jgi:hypothetical protein
MEEFLGQRRSQLPTQTFSQQMALRTCTSLLAVGDHGTMILWPRLQWVATQSTSQWGRKRNARPLG